MKSITTALVAAIYVSRLAEAKPVTRRQTDLPTVDLGYEIHQALSLNTNGSFYTFQNIPFAAPPLGDLRFAAPQPPLQRDRNTTNNGSDGIKLCPQASTSWNNQTYAFALQYARLLATNSTEDVDSLSVIEGIAPFSYAGPRQGESEDCLYLNVAVPEAIFQAGEDSKAPVLVEIYGGGYIGGSKDTVAGANTTPAGLLQRSNNSIIYVALNYRLGAFGFSAGSDLESAGGNSNAGLLDQRAALEWVQQYIHLFGGDPDQVTLVGESAGGGSIEHQITAYGGTNGSVPFARAIPQSPGFIPTNSDNFTNSIFQQYLEYAGASSLQELRQLNSSQLMRANAQQVYENPNPGSFTYGPVVDGSFVPDLPGRLFSQGKFDKNVSILSGHNSREGYFFTPPTLTNDTEIYAQLSSVFPSASPNVLQFITNNLYPPIYDGSQPYTNFYERSTLLISEFAFICNNYYMLAATGQSSYGYLFDIFPSFHSQDIAYTFYAGTPANTSNFFGVQNVETAYSLQDWIVSFAMGEQPRSAVQGTPALPVYAQNFQIGHLEGFGGELEAGLTTEPAMNIRCQWWQQGFYAT